MEKYLNTENKNIVEQKLFQIIDIFKNDEFKNWNLKVGLFSGAAGIVLFLYSFLEIFDDNDINTLAKETLEKSTNIINNNNTTPDYSVGISGWAWVLKYFEKKEVISKNDLGFLKDLDVFLYNNMITYLKTKDYDYLSAASGICLYFIKCYEIDRENTNFVQYINQYIDIMDEISESNEKKIYRWKSKILVNRIGAKKEVYNLGISHGMASLIAIFSKILKLGINEIKTKKMLNGTIKYILNNSQSYDIYGSHFSSYVFEDQQKIEAHSRLAWCYGDLGIAVALFQASQVLNNKGLEKFSIEVLIHNCERRNLEKEIVWDAGLCHGTAGIAHIFNRMYRNTQIEQFKETSNFWINETLKMAKFEDGLAGYKRRHFENSEFIWVNEYGVLEGIAGIGLALISSINYSEPNWDECLLLS
jgi:lantibiotic biosynthesis protein